MLDALLVQDHLAEAVSCVLETMCFALVSPVPANGGPPSDHLRCVRIGFRGGLTGWFLLAAPFEAAQSLAPDFLGLQAGEIPSAECVDEVLAELANMICGATLSRLDRHAIFHLGSPEFMAPFPPGENVYAFDFGSGRMQVRWEME